MAAASVFRCFLQSTSAGTSLRLASTPIRFPFVRCMRYFAATRFPSTSVFQSRTFHSHCWLGVKASSLTGITQQQPVGCPICSRELTFTYKDVLFLSQFLSPEGHMLNRRVTGVCAKQQKKLEKAVKISRRLGLLPMCGNPSALTPKEQRK